ncbi:MAG: AAA family ATPase [Gammaproteobacteria bacterium]
MLDLDNLTLLLKSHFPIIVIETHEETRAIQLLRDATAAGPGKVLSWSATEGLTEARGPNPNQSHPVFRELHLEGEVPQQTHNSTEPDAMLERVKRHVRDSIVVLLDFHPYLSEPRIVRLVKEIALQHHERQTRLVFISHEFSIPPEFQKLCTRFELALPDKDKIRQLVKDEAKIWSLRNGQKVRADSKAVDLLIQNLTGVTTSDAKRLIRNAIYNDGAITHSDIKEVMEAKYQLVAQGGVLAFEYDTAEFADVGGFQHLKAWLEKRKPVFLGQDASKALDPPKGILLLGVQGCGKSLAAKSIAGVWGVPLLRLDFGALFNKYIGETEKNIREALKSAEVLSPCVLWIDEIEKGIQTTDSTSGTAQRVLGTFLTWMAENKKHVFVVATANDVQALPPELIRKGRLDEIFFVDLPEVQTRKEILAVHLRKRDLDVSRFDLALLGHEAQGFSGAELEQAVVAASYSAFAEQRAVNNEDILNEIHHTRPLSRVMAEKISALRDWARDRTVAAN